MDRGSTPLISTFFLKMNFIEKNKDEIILKFKNGKNVYLYSKNNIKDGWPVYESWVNDSFLGHWEFIPNKSIGIDSDNYHKYWAFVYDYLFIFSSNHLPHVILEKDGDNFKGHQINNFNMKYELKYIET